MVYKFKTGSYKGLDAQQTGDELERIRTESEGKLETHQVWRAARDENSPLHKAFTWDLEKAAEEHWANQAMKLIRAVVLVDGEEQTSAFINVSVRIDEDGQESTVHYYQASQLIAENPREIESALAMNRSRLASAQNGLQELLSLVKKRQQPRIRRAVRHVESAVKEIAL
jgi:hypothetical protein